MKYYFVLFSLTTLSFCLKAQTTILPIEKDIIEVVGKAEKEIMPDEIYVKITLKEKTESREKITIEQQEEKLKKAVLNANIDLKNLAISDVNSNYIKVRWNTKDVMTQKEYMLKTSTPQQLRLLFTELNKVEVKEAEIDHVSHSKIDSITKAVRIDAIKAAKDKAGYLLTAINEKVGNCILVQESNPQMFVNTNAISNNSYSNYSYNSVSVSEDVSQDLGFQKISIEYSIFCKFEIKH